MIKKPQSSYDYLSLLLLLELCGFLEYCFNHFQSYYKFIFHNVFLGNTQNFFFEKRVDIKIAKAIDF